MKTEWPKKFRFEGKTIELERDEWKKVEYESRFSKCWVCGRLGQNEDGTHNVRMWNNGFCAYDCSCEWKGKYFRNTEDGKRESYEVFETSYCEGHGKGECCGEILMDTLDKRHPKYKYIGELPHYSLPVRVKPQE